MTQNAEKNAPIQAAKGDDLRVRRTRKAIQQAMLDLTVEKGFAAITVRDLTERAMINRSTFYRHYLDKFDLLKQYTDEVAALTSDDAFVAARRAQSPDDTPSGLMRLLRHVQENAAFYRVMFSVDGDPQFTDHFRRSTEHRFRTLFALVGATPDPDAPPIEMRIKYISHAGVGAIRWWLENDQPCTVEQFGQWLSQLSTTSAGLPPHGSPVYRMK